MVALRTYEEMQAPGEPLGEVQVDQLARCLEGRMTPAPAKQHALAQLARDAGPRALAVLAAYAEAPGPGLEEGACEALETALSRTPGGAGYDRNSPCPCGSGSKWKHCCAKEPFRWCDGGREKRAKLNGGWR